MNLKLSLLLATAAAAGVVTATIVGRKSWSVEQAASVGSPTLVARQNNSEVRSPATVDSAKDPAHPRSLRENYCSEPYRTTCGTSWPSEDPTGKVRLEIRGEVHTLRYMRRLIRAHPTWTSGQVEEALAHLIFTEPRRKRALDGFQWVIKAIHQIITAQPDSVFSPQEKTALLERISRIVFELPPPVSVYADAPDLLTKNTVYYERTSENVLRLRLGGAYLMNTTSWFNLIYTLAHEVAHSIDPCEAKLAKIAPRAYPKLVSCFVAAGWVAAERTECGPDEQVSEVFADWIASEVTSQAIRAVGRDYTPDQRTSAAINAARDLCEEPIDEPLDYSTHQQPNVRVGTVVGRNPSIRRVLGCQPAHTVKYCRFEPVETPASH